MGSYISTVSVIAFAVQCSIPVRPPAATITDFPFEFNIPQECAFLPMFNGGPCFFWKLLSGSNIQVEERMFVLLILDNGLWPPMMKIELEL